MSMHTPVCWETLINTYLLSSGYFVMLLLVIEKLNKRHIGLKVAEHDINGSSDLMCL